MIQNQRGALAWLNAQSRDFVGSMREGQNLLLAHKIQDKANLREYLPASGKLADLGEANQEPFSTKGEKDETVVDFMAHECYKKGRDVSWGRKKKIVAHQPSLPQHEGVSSPQCQGALELVGIDVPEGG